MYAKGKRALGICDRCGFRFLLSELKFETTAGRKTNIRVCKECLDPDDPKDRPEKYTKRGPEKTALKDPRPDPNPSGSSE